MRENRTPLMKVYNPAEPKLRWQIDLSHSKVHHLICTAWKRLKKDFKGAQGLVGKSSVMDEHYLRLAAKGDTAHGLKFPILPLKILSKWIHPFPGIRILKCWEGCILRHRKQKALKVPFTWPWCILALPSQNERT